MLGVCAALELSRRGCSVTLIEGAADVLQGASRWNEGKIHLGYLYAADPSLRTATRLIPGGLAFSGLVSRLLGCSVDAFATEDELFLVHRHSVVDPATFAAYAARTTELVLEASSQAQAPAYLADLSVGGFSALSAHELGQVTSNDDVVAGFRVPERSVSTVAVADLMTQALAAEPRVEVHTHTWIKRVQRRDDGRFDVITDAAPPAIARLEGPFDVLINALWEGRLAIDAGLGILPPAPWTHRFRAAVFGRSAATDLRSAVVCTGPFGDIKRYPDGRLYMSWYDAGLLAQGHDIEPPRSAAVLTEARRDGVMNRTLTALSKFFPEVQNLRQHAELEIQGGWVYAVGQGSLGDRSSSLHRRDRFDITLDRGYISVDTAKYSLAPSLASQVADIVTAL
jgi:glycine/D-amino acid oxidase-like deaminating enzyme